MRTAKRNPRFTERPMRPARMLSALFAALYHSFAEVFKTEGRLHVLKSRAAPDRNNYFIEAEFGLSVFEDEEEDTGSDFISLKAPPLSYRPDEIDLAEQPLIHILCGFLGSGKTTFLQNWLNFRHRSGHRADRRRNLCRSTQ